MNAASTLKKSVPQKGQHEITFPRQLYDLIEKTDDKIIKWTGSGTAFQVLHQSGLEKVMGQFFRHSKYGSLQRQLNMYGFRKHVRGDLVGSFVHPSFHHGMSDFTEIVNERKAEKKLAATGRSFLLPLSAKIKTHMAAEKASLISNSEEKEGQSPLRRTVSSPLPKSRGDAVWPRRKKRSKRVNGEDKETGSNDEESNSSPETIGGSGFKKDSSQKKAKTTNTRSKRSPSKPPLLNTQLYPGGRSTGFTPLHTLVRSVGTQVDPPRPLVISTSVSADTQIISTSVSADSISTEMDLGLRHKISFEDKQDVKKVEKTIKVSGKDRFMID